MTPEISLVILTHNKEACTRRCMSRLLLTRGVAWDLVVIDNGSTDGTRAWLETFREEAKGEGVEVTLKFNDGNIGCSTARNQGLALARGPHVAFLDNDVTVRQRDWLCRLEGALTGYPDAVMVGPKLVYPYPPHAIQCAGAAVSPTGRVQFMGRGEPRDDPRFNQAREVQCLISACCLARKSALEKVGGFDEAFNPVEYEDIDLCYRLREQGGRLWYEPSVEMYHFESVTTAGTATLPNTYLIVRHGLLFKQRWHTMFSRENGPPDKETCWRPIEAVPFDSIGELPLVQ